MWLQSSLSRARGAWLGHHGQWDPAAVALGARVEAGSLAGWYHDLERLETPEEALRFAEGGIVISHRLHTDSQAGDCLIQVAEPIDG